MIPKTLESTEEVILFYDDKLKRFYGFRLEFQDITVPERDGCSRQQILRLFTENYFKCHN